MTFKTNGKQDSAPLCSQDARSNGDPVRPRNRARIGGILLLFVLLGLAHPQHLAAQAVRGNAGFATDNLGKNDDDSALSGVLLGFNINFFGNSFDQVYVNNNGNVTFSGPVSSYTPEGLTASPLPIIAAFWADVDTRGANSSVVTYGRDTVGGRPAFGVNYLNVGYFSSHDDKLNRFQLILIDRSDTGPGNFDIEFNYDRIVWETGDASGGSGGLGGTSAAVGYSNGSRTAAGSFELSGSRVPGSYLDSSPSGLTRRSAGGSNVPGRLVFGVRNGEVSCSFGIAPSSAFVGAAAGSSTVSVSSQVGCAWTAASNSSFLAITAGAAGNGAGTVAYSFTGNTETQRTGTLTIAGQTFTVTQASSLPVPILRPQSFRFTGFVGGSHQRQSLQIAVASGTLSFQARAAILNGTGWLVVSPPSGTATSNVPSSLIVDVDFGAFSTPGAYQADVVIEHPTGGVLARVPLTAVVSPAGPQLLLSQNSFLFRTAGGTPPPQSLRIVNGGLSAMNWTIPSPATLTAPLNWLVISSLSGSVSPGTSGSSTTLSINTAGLTPGVYQALVPVAASGAANSPQLVTVTLHVAPAATPASPEFSSSGILFVVREGATQVPPFNLALANTGGGTSSFVVQITTESGGNWLTVSSASGSISSQSSTIAVRPSIANLTLGTYRGRLRATFTPGGTREVNVTLIYSGVPVVPQRDGPVAAACAASSMEVVVNSIGAGSVVPVSFPRPLLATVVDSCGTGLNDATVVATAEGRTIPLAALGEGLFSGTWVPEQQSASSPVSFVALHPTYTTVERTVTVSTSAAAGGASLPSLFSDGLVEGAAFTSRRPLAPGGIVSLFGSRLAPSDALATRLPLDRSLGGVSVRIGEEDAPLYFAGAGQINAQVPYSVRPGESVSVVMRVNGQLTAPQTYLVAPAQPGIFLAGGGGAILDGQSRLVNADNPAQRGDILQIFATGLGQTDPPAQTGEGAPSFSRVLLPVTVTVGGVEAPVEYQGLAPGFVGLYQVNVRLPTTVTPGDNIEVVIKQNGITSNPDRPATIPVR